MMQRTIFSTRLLSRTIRARPFSCTPVSLKTSETSVEDIQAQQHSGSRKAPEPTQETGTSTQAPHDAPASTPPGGQQFPKQPEFVGSSEPGRDHPMATNEDGSGEIKSNSPFRAAPLEKSVGAKTVPPDLEAIERMDKANKKAKKESKGKKEKKQST
ncbi:hypothetical protein BCR37DRAFT_254008 [Protomyces lactucae-debilis]|uniref:Uncharacterized protein n=1 Tax=Protomyces lactucae-debilis TaxID=2754530 RepID=A0A1Y2FLR0_PROLT|nr:uncharacterized protein BCR37DRAFT_254008 [Protomyces lactucae-debilis]ORY84888.1 hypothetical protein BCR37DRAFT_254008 [Protomyces lactucae-debilis]